MDVVERELRSVFAALICSSVLSTRALTDDVNDDRENIVVVVSTDEVVKRAPDRVVNVAAVVRYGLVVVNKTPCDVVVNVDGVVVDVTLVVSGNPVVKSGPFVVLKMFVEVDVIRDNVVVDATVVLNVVVVILVVRLGEEVVISPELVVKIGTVDVVRMIPAVVAGANVVVVVVMVLVVVKEVVSI